MIVLNNISKKYFSKDKKETIALNNISLNFPNKGLISIVGRSGSGKSTLLKIIGCILTPSNGNVFYNNINMNTFTDKENDALRANHIGFIFQEFHLLDKLTVYENIKLALDIQNQNEQMTNEHIINSLEQLNILSLKNRFITELSNGERQRVAIARAIAKGCKVILADEPTGSLDEENADSVYEILKELSKNLLVILVTHEKEAAFKYSNRVITLKSGSVSQDKNVDEIIDNEKKVHVNLKREPLKNNQVLSWSNKMLRRRFRKFTFTILFWTFSLTFLFTSLNLLLINKVNISSRVINDYNISHFKITRTSFDPDLVDMKKIDFEVFHDRKGIKYNDFYYSDIFSMDTISYIKHNSDNLLQHFYLGNLFNYIEITDNGNLIDIEGIKLNKGEIFISDYQASKLIFYGVFDVEDIADCIGEKIIVLDKFEFIIKGIYKTDYKNYLTDNYIALNDDGLPQFFYDRYFNSKKDNEYSTIFMSQETFDSLQSFDDNFTTSVNGFQSNVYNADFLNNLGSNGYLGNIPTSNNEIAVSIVFLSYVLGQDVNEDNIDTFIEKKYSIKISNNENEEVNDYKIVGVTYTTGNNIFYLPEEYQRLAETYAQREIDDSIYTKGISASIENNENLTSFIKLLLDNDYFYHTYISFDVLWAIEFVESTRNLYRVISIISLFILIMMIYFFSSTLILDNKKMIGVVTSLGCSKKETSKIFIFENIKMFLLSFFFSVLILIIIINYLNEYIIKNSGIDFNLIRPNPLIIFIAGLCSLIITFICSMVPIIRLTKKDMVDLIYDL